MQLHIYNFTYWQRQFEWAITIFTIVNNIFPTHILSKTFLLFKLPMQIIFIKLQMNLNKTEIKTEILFKKSK